jgi:phthiodiolone/phenolphthiodiolone dimycocerosates ketoreductase
MMRATGRYADGWFPGTTRADEYGEQLGLVRTAASDAGRDPMDIMPALIRFIVTGRSRDEIDEVVESDIAKVFTLNCDGGHGRGTAPNIRLVPTSPVHRI